MFKIKIQKRSYKSACHLMCYQCHGADLEKMEAEKGTQNLIKQCTAKKCAIYDFRPYK